MTRSLRTAIDRLWGAAWLEGCAFALALASVLWVAQAVQQHGQEGVLRWQKDAQGVGDKASKGVAQTLTGQWCQRDQDFIAQWSADRWPCRTEIDGLWSAVWRGLREPAAWTPQQQQPYVQRWQQELLASSQQWRARLQAADAARIGAALASESEPETARQAAPTASSEAAPVQFEPQLGEDVRRLQMQSNERLAQWDRWVLERVLPLVQVPPNEVQVEALWGLAQSLSGEGSDVGARQVSLALKASENARRAGYSLQLMAHLPLLLVAHAVFTAVATLWMRTSVAPLAQLNGLLVGAFLFWAGMSVAGLAPSPLTSPLVLAAGAGWLALTWVWGHFFPHKLPLGRSSRLVVASWIPAWWAFTALGWLLLLDQSLHFHERLRFLALEQWWSWCLSAVLLPLAAWAAPWTLNAGLRLARSAWALWPRGGSWLHWCAAALGVAVLALAHRQGVPQHVTGELLKAAFVVGMCSWCIWKMPITAQLWHAGHARVAWRGLGDVAGCLVLAAAAAFLTADKGPLLVIALLVAVLLSTVLGWTTGVVMLVLGFAAIFWLGVDLDVVGERLQAWRDPFTAKHDDMARLVWFQTEAARWPWGFGVGQVPWCGTSRLDACQGLPLQLQSDYTFTALMGWWGPWGAWLCLLAFTAAVYRVLVHCARESQGLLKPQLLLQPEVVARAWTVHLLFLFSVLMLMQTWITVAGNLGWLPLTGVTWPLMGYGKTSLWVSTVFVGAFGLRRPHA